MREFLTQLLNRASEHKFIFAAVVGSIAVLSRIEWLANKLRYLVALGAKEENGELLLDMAWGYVLAVSLILLIGLLITVGYMVSPRRARVERLEKSIAGALKAATRIVNQLRPHSSEVNYAYTNVTHTYVVEQTGTTKVTALDTIYALKEPLYFKEQWMRAEKEAPAVKLMDDLDLKIRDCDESRGPPAYLVTKDEDHHKGISVFFFFFFCRASILKRDQEGF